MIERFSKHLSKIFTPYRKNDKIMEFKEELLGSLMDRYNELKASGLTDEESYTKSLEILDGITDTITTLEQEYGTGDKKVNPIQKYLLPAGIYWLSVVLIYLVASAIIFSFDSMTWLIFIGGVLIFGVAVGVVFFKVAKEKKLKFLSKSNLWVIMFCLSTAAYLVWSFVSKHWEYTWIAFFIGLFVWYIVDILYRLKASKGKEVIKIGDVIALTVILTLIVYFFVSFIGHMWATSWILFVVMALIILVELMVLNKK